MYQDLDEVVSTQTAPHELPVITAAGQPNSGKTTLFNALTGSHYKTSNYPGATVEYSEGKLEARFGYNALIVDTPGIISLTPESPDEEVTINGLFDHPKYGLPDLVILATDCTQLSRQLYPAKQMLDAGFKVVIALTMHDLLERKDLRVDTAKLSRLMNCLCVIVDSRKGTGLKELVVETRKVIEAAKDSDYKDMIKKPEYPTEEAVMELYKFTEHTEHEVIVLTENKLAESKPDIKEINKKYFNQVKRAPHKESMKLDRIFLHPVWGLLIFVISMGVIFTSIFWIAQPLMDLVDSGFGILGEAVGNALPADTWYNNLITKGIIGGLGSVMIFVPQIAILFLLLGLLEDTGYLARAAMLIDKPLTYFGLNGRSFVPMLSGYACAIPAMMAARTITNRRERYLTIFIIPLMSCSARLPVYALLLAFIVPPSKPWIGGLALGGLYLFSIAASALVAGIITKFKKREDKSTFMLELPAYRTPVVSHVFRSTIHKTASYVKGAGPMIVFISLILWTITYFPDMNPELKPTQTEGMNEEQVSKLAESERLNNSYAGYVGKMFEPIVTPLGWDWRVGVSLISAFAAREVFVSSMAITMSITETDDDNMQTSILNSMRDAKIQETGKPLFTAASTISLIIYFMFAMQCLSTVAVARKETGGWRIPILQTVLYTVMAYVFAFIAYNGLRAMGVE